MESFLEWIKNSYETVKSFFADNFLIFLILISTLIIVLNFIVARICTCNNYYAALGRKFKKLNVIIRDNQLAEDREKFLLRFNKTVKKQNKKFASAWNSYLLDEGQDASMIFTNTKFDKGKKGFFNFFLIFSWVVSFCAITLVLTYKKFDFSSSDSIYILILVPVFIIVLGLLFNLIYVTSRNKQRADMLNHLEFFVANVDESIKGFAKADFELCGIKKIDQTRQDKVSTYDEYLKSKEDGLNFTNSENIEGNLAKEKTSKALAAAMLLEKNTANEDLEQNAKDEEKILAAENESEIDESKEKLLNNLKKLKNLEVMTDDNNQTEEDEHPFEDVDVDIKEEVAKELSEVIENKKTELDNSNEGEGLKIMSETPVKAKATVKKQTTKKKSEIAKALDGLKKAKSDAKKSSKAKPKTAKAKSPAATKTASKASVAAKPKTATKAKAPAKKQVVKPAAKTPAKTVAKPAAKKVAVKKAPAKKVAAAPAKKTVTKVATAKKTSVKKAQVKPAVKKTATSAKTKKAPAVKKIANTAKPKSATKKKTTKK